MREQESLIFPTGHIFPLKSDVRIGAIEFYSHVYAKLILSITGFQHFPRKIITLSSSGENVK